MSYFNKKNLWIIENNYFNVNSSQIFAPPEDLIATSQLEFELSGLEPDSEYRIQIVLILRDLNTHPSSQTYTVRTPPERTITVPTLITEDILHNIVDPQFKAIEVNSTFVRLTWNKIPDDEIEFVDAIQIRYRELNYQIYNATPFIHRFVEFFDWFCQ